MNQPAFDSLTPTYDDSFTHTAIGRYLREQVHARLDRRFHADDHVLELGCGTGEDALYLASRGVRVTATDVSDAMLNAARAKTAGNPLVSVDKLDLRKLPQDASANFDGVYSNFGPLNCLDDWQPLAAWLAQRIRPGGIAGFSLLCLGAAVAWAASQF